MPKFLPVWLPLERSEPSAGPPPRPRLRPLRLKPINNDIAAAFSPGYWEGTFETYDGDGKLLKTAKNPSCIRANDKESVPGEMRGLTEMMDQTSDCTVAAAKPGTLELTMTCKSGNGFGATFTSKAATSQARRLTCGSPSKPSAMTRPISPASTQPARVRARPAERAGLAQTKITSQ